MKAELILWRRHLGACPHKAKGREYSACQCPIWCDGYPGGARLRRSMETANWERAERKLHMLLDPQSAPPPAIPVDGVIAEYLGDCRSRRLAEGTLRSYEKTLEHFNVFCTAQQHTMDSLSLEAMTAYRCDWVRAASTQRKELAALRAFFAFALDRKLCADNWAKKLKPPKGDSLPTLPFEQVEIHAILAACETLGNREADWAFAARDRARAIVLLLLYSGLRISDAAALERKALNPENGKLFIRRQQKTGTPVYVALPSSVVQVLFDLPGSVYFFASGNSLPATTTGNLRRTITRVLVAAGIKGHPHRFRDTFAVRLLEEDVPLRTVQILLGHDSIRTTEKHYSPFVRSQQRLLDAAVSKLDFLKVA